LREVGLPTSPGARNKKKRGRHSRKMCWGGALNTGIGFGERGVDYQKKSRVQGRAIKTTG